MGETQQRARCGTCVSNVCWWRIADTASFTLFQLITLDDWFELYDAIRIAESEPGGQEVGGPHPVFLYFFAYIVIENFIFVNLFTAVIVNNLEMNSRTVDSSASGEVTVSQEAGRRPIAAVGAPVEAAPAALPATTIKERTAGSAASLLASMEANTLEQSKVSAAVSVLIQAGVLNKGRRRDNSLQIGMLLQNREVVENVHSSRLYYGINYTAPGSGWRRKPHRRPFAPPFPLALAS